MGLSKYVLQDKLSESRHTAIYKAYHKMDPERPLVVKLLKSTGLDGYKKSRLEQKIEHLRILHDQQLIVPIALETRNDACFITQDYFDGIPLDRLRQMRGVISLGDFFTIACGIARALTKVHAAGIIHGGIKPHNILVNPATLEIRLIDFMSTVDIRDVSHFIHDPSFIRETLCYTSPEQTGRISHRMGFSSDMYSLGIVLYELLAGRPPFLSDDPLEVIHSHLALEAPEVHTVNPAVPVVVSRLVARLLLKEPEKRYQSSNGLLDDLQRCRDDYTAAGTIREFPLESHLYTHRVTFISKMVGRDREAETILAHYEQAAEGSFQSFFISGLSGMGKTRLIQELQKPIVRHRGYFTSGKFDVYQKNIPYSSLIQAFRNLMRTFLTESDDRIALWKERILKAVGTNGQVLTDVIPELTLLIGPQPDAPRLPPVESLNRFHDLFDRFLGCLASKEHPLVLFIDDLQWCDVASFDFLANIFANHREHPYLFLLGAYRHNEVDQAHPLFKLITAVRDNGGPLREIRLEPLQQEHCHEMVSYILDSPLHQTGDLARFIGALADGNPLFISESLAYLHNEELLFMDGEKQWRWDMDKVRESDMPTTVVALFSSKIGKLPPELVNLIEQCACIGNSFSPAKLADLRGMTLTEIFELLKPALGQGLLMERKNKLQFVHDKVQEAALATIPAERRHRIHQQIGAYLLANLPEGTDPEKLDNLFTIVSHLNLGREEHPDDREAYLLSDINFHAGNKALDSLATEAANGYFRISRELLPADCWEAARYDRTFRIFQKAAKAELMCGNYSHSEELLSELLDHAESDLDKAECLAEQTTSLSSVGNFIKAIETANRGLAYFHKAIPDSPAEADAARKTLMAEIAAHPGDVWESILNMPFTTDRRGKIELAFYSELIPDLYMSGLASQLYLAAAYSTRHCLAGGMDESVIYSFSIMGLQHGECEEFEQAFRYEDLAHNLSARYPNTFGATRGMNGIVWCTMHSRSHPAQIVEYALKAIQCGRNCGDLYNAGLSYGPLMWNLQVQGANLSAIEEYARECLQFSRKYNLSFSVGLARAMHAGWIAPMKNGYRPIDMEEALRQWEQDNHVASAGSYYVHLGIAHVYLGEHEQAGEYLEKVRTYLSGLTDNVLKREWHAFRVVNALRLHEKGAPRRDEAALLAEIAPLVEKLRTWAGLGPLLKPYLAFVEAELARLRGGFGEARGLYLDAISTAHEQGYTLLEGHLNECLAELLLRQGHPTARIYVAEAARLYRSCGAERKESILAERYPDCFWKEKTDQSHAGTEPFDSVLSNLDVNYLMKSSLAISAEIVPEALLDRIMNVVIECSGAQHGYLLMVDNDELSVRAESHAAEKTAVRPHARTLDDATDICASIVRYVRRTGERVVLHDACREGMFRNDRDVQELQLRSVLCLPVVKLTRMIGVLYLENRLADGVFTQEKTQMTELLTSQAAISMENARLMEGMKKAEEALCKANNELEQRVAERTAEINEKNRLLQQQSRLAAMGEMINNIAHQWRQPLNILGMNIQRLFLFYDTDKFSKEFLHTSTRDAMNVIQHMSKTIDDFRNFFKPDREMADFSINQAIGQAINLVDDSFKSNHIKIITRFDGDARTCGYPNEFAQVILNILQNAREALQERKTPDGMVTVTTSGTQESAVITIADNAGGIPAEILPKVFEPYFSTKGVQGTGIGLYMSKNIIETNLKGSLTVRNTGQGAEFTIEIQEGKDA